MEYIEKYYPENKEIKCNFCGCIKMFKSFNFILRGDYVYISNIKYKDTLNVCGIPTAIAYKKCDRLKYYTNSKKYVSILYGVDIEEANKIILERNSSPFYKTNFKSEKEYKDNQRRDKKYFTKKYNEKIDKGKYHSSLEYHIKKYGYDEGYKIYNEKQIKKDSSSLSYFTKKYGEIEGLKKYNEKIDKCKITQDNIIKKYGEIEGLKKWNDIIKKKHLYAPTKETRKRISQGITKFNQSLTAEERVKKYGGKLVDKYISKYGYKIGEKKYSEFLSRLNTSKICRASKESLVLLRPIMDFCYKRNLDFFIGLEKNKEFSLYDKISKKIYFYDFCIPSIRLIIEYNGSMFHFNENYEYKSDANMFGIKFEDMKKKDELKRNLAVSNEFKIIEIFDTDMKNEEKINTVYKIIEERLLSGKRK